MTVNGTTYHEETPAEVIRVLEEVRANDTRIRLVYGDTETGRSWQESCSVTGTLGRSCGPMKVPLILAQGGFKWRKPTRYPRTLGGPAILDHCIIGIRHSSRKNGGWLYRHPLYTGDE